MLNTCFRLKGYGDCFILIYNFTHHIFIILKDDNSLLSLPLISVLVKHYLIEKKKNASQYN